jgi:hypothetical protein
MLHKKIGKNVLGSKHSKICEKNHNKNICTKLNNNQLWDWCFSSQLCDVDEVMIILREFSQFFYKQNMKKNKIKNVSIILATYYNFMYNQQLKLIFSKFKS